MSFEMYDHVHQQKQHLVGLRPLPSLPLFLVWLQNPLVQDGVILAHTVRAVRRLLL